MSRDTNWRIIYGDCSILVFDWNKEKSDENEDKRKKSADVQLCCPTLYCNIRLYTNNTLAGNPNLGAESSVWNICPIGIDFSVYCYVFVSESFCYWY